MSNRTVSFSPSRNANSARSYYSTQEGENQILNHILEMGKRRVGLEDKTHYKRPPFEFRNSYNLNNPNLKKGHRLYLNDLCYTVIISKKFFLQTSINLNFNFTNVLQIYFF